MTSRAIGIYPGHLIGASFGVVFVIVNGGLLGQPAQLLAGVLACIAAAMVLIGFVATIRRGQQPPERDMPRSRTAFLVIVGIEAVLLFGGLALLNQWQPAANVGWIALIVGLHFLAFALWWIPGQRELVVIGAVMSALGVIGLVIAFTSHDEALVQLIAGVGSGLVFLATSCATAMRVLLDRGPETQPE
ncbi:hypothetical protein [Agromyces laixinhei]|uniref:hypothetical protein n=1 Tax=Agromyces laixinhei TaxID=2585717 RepID=UPI001115B70D|nr:hypothetical protein [Agromyces laixinhei]